MQRRPYCSSQDTLAIHSLANVLSVLLMHSCIEIANITMHCIIIFLQWKDFVLPTWLEKSDILLSVSSFSTAMVAALDVGDSAVSFCTLFISEEEDYSPEISKLNYYLWMQCLLKRKQILLKKVLIVLCVFPIPHMLLFICLNEDWSSYQEVPIAFCFLIIYTIWTFYYLFCYIPNVKVQPPTIVKRIQEEMTIPN